jgi:hypothetical protein
MERSSWIRVNRRDPCCRCNSCSWCARSADGGAVYCMRVESDKPLPSGGWIHRLNDPLPVLPERKPVKKIANVTELANKMFNSPSAAEKRVELSRSLGVSLESLYSLRVGIGWDHDGQEYSSWPARDPGGSVIGITRRYADGAKLTLAGTSNSGVFLPDRWPDRLGRIVVVEGGSDTAALHTCNINAIGRPSNVGGAKIIREILKKHGRDRRVMVVGENDEKPHKRGFNSWCPKDCKGCAWCFPGMYGARKVASELGCPWFMLPKEYKDVRDWHKRETVDFPSAFWLWIYQQERKVA